MGLKNAARKGKRSERRALEHLCEMYGIQLGDNDDTKAQWTKSAQSKGVWDLIAWNSTTAYYVQVKSNNPPRPDERERIEKAIVPDCAQKLIMIVKDGVNASRAVRIEVYFYRKGSWYDISGKRARFCAFGKRKADGASSDSEAVQRVCEEGLFQYSDDDAGDWLPD